MASFAQHVKSSERIELAPAQYNPIVLAMRKVRGINKTGKRFVIPNKHDAEIKTEVERFNAVLKQLSPSHRALKVGEISEFLSLNHAGKKMMLKDNTVFTQDHVSAYNETLGKSKCRFVKACAATGRVSGNCPHYSKCVKNGLVASKQEWEATRPQRRELLVVHVSAHFCSTVAALAEMAQKGGKVPDVPKELQLDNIARAISRGAASDAASVSNASTVNGEISQEDAIKKAMGGRLLLDQAAMDDAARNGTEEKQSQAMCGAD